MEKNHAKRQYADFPAFLCSAANPALYSDIHTLAALHELIQHWLMIRHRKMMSE